MKIRPGLARVFSADIGWSVAIVVLLAAPVAGAENVSDTATGDNATLPSLNPEAFDRSAAAHLLSRTGFGGSPHEIEECARAGLDAAVATLFESDSRVPLDEFEPTLRPSQELRREFRRLPREERKKRRQQLRRQDQREFQRLRGWWMRRMAMSPRPLEEKMVLFWHGHFTSSQRAVRSSYLMYLQNRTFRDNAFGNFRELTRKIARDPAMLRYLNNNQNNRGKPNENFARELMELFTLGVGNYTEKDIKEAARAFTGWKARNGQFFFQPRQHDGETKTFLGKTGNFDGDDIVDILFEQPEASRFIVRKLFTFFVHDDPSKNVIESLAATLRESDFNISPVLSQLFRSQEFYSEPARGSRIKSPVELVIGSFRLLGLDPGDTPASAFLAARLGQNIFQPPNVKGWDGGRDWISTSTIAERYRMPTVLLAGDREMGKRMMRRFQDTDMNVSMPSWDPAVHGAILLGDDHATLTPKEAVSRLLNRFLLVPVTDKERQDLIKTFQTAKKGNRLRKVLTQILASPNYQLG